jgi:hypothetical protein
MSWRASQGNGGFAGAVEFYINWSAIGKFRRCPLKNRFWFIDALPEESVSWARIFGAGIHRDRNPQPLTAAG